jgi:hypothetical protein
MVEFKVFGTHNNHEGEAGQPGCVRFPFEPGQFVGHRCRRDQVFHSPVKAAAVDLPRVTLDALRQIASGLLAEVEVNEIERTADPSDCGYHVQPTQDQACPFC